MKIKTTHWSLRTFLINRNSSSVAMPVQCLPVFGAPCQSLMATSCPQLLQMTWTTWSLSVIPEVVRISFSGLREVNLFDPLIFLDILKYYMYVARF